MGKRSTLAEIRAQRDAINALPVRGSNAKARAAFITEKRLRLESFDRLIQARIALGEDDEA